MYWGSIPDAVTRAELATGCGAVAGLDCARAATEANVTSMATATYCELLTNDMTRSDRGFTGTGSMPPVRALSPAAIYSAPRRRNAAGADELQSMNAELFSATILLILVLDPFGNLPIVVSVLAKVPAQRRAPGRPARVLLRLRDPRCIHGRRPHVHAAGCNCPT